MSRNKPRNAGAADRWLWRLADRRALTLGGGCAVVQVAATIVCAIAIVGCFTAIRDGESGWWFAAVTAASGLVRGGSVLAGTAVAAAGAARSVRRLRRRTLERLTRLPRDILNPARMLPQFGAGLDGITAYLARYVPQAVTAAVVVPTLVVTLWLLDPLSGLVVSVVLPVTPIMLALIGLATGAVQQRHWTALTALGTGFVQAVGGLTTLVLYGRERRQIARVRELTEAYRVHTMQVLRVTFLSGFALELAASVSVAIMAVEIGLRLLEGMMPLATGLIVLLLAPDVFLPIRALGAAFHDATAGREAARELLPLVPVVRGASARLAAASRGVSGEGLDVAPGGPTEGLVLHGLGVRVGERDLVRAFTLTVAPGEIVALTGPSGVGKSSVLGALLGYVPHTGRVTLDGEPFRGIPDVAWMGQQPQLNPGTVGDNIRLGDEDADPALAVAAAVVAGLDIALDAVVDATGGGLSGGQVQRVALARAVHRLWARRLRVLLLDEPTAALDAAREGAVWRGLAALAATGVAILVTTHRPVLAVDADETPGHPFPDDGDPAHRPVAADGAVPTVTRVILLERVG